jgi:hypothetical protein
VPWCGIQHGEQGDDRGDEVGGVELGHGECDEGFKRNQRSSELMMGMMGVGD